MNGRSDRRRARQKRSPISGFPFQKSVERIDARLKSHFRSDDCRVIARLDPSAALQEKRGQDNWNWNEFLFHNVTSWLSRATLRSSRR
jgi:hypothetical protein